MVTFLVFEFVVSLAATELFSSSVGETKHKIHAHQLAFASLVPQSGQAVVVD